MNLTSQNYVLLLCKYCSLTVRVKATCLVHTETPSNVKAVQLNWKKLEMSKRLHKGFLLHSFPFWAHCVCVSQTGLSICQGSLFCGRTFNLFQTFSVKELKCNWKGQERRRKKKKKKKSMWALPRFKYDVNANLYSQRLCANFHVQSYLLQFQSMWFCWMKIMNSGAINQIEERVTSTSDLHSANEYEMWKQ